jgi:hypothetical protein
LPLNLKCRDLVSAAAPVTRKALKQAVEDLFKEPARWRGWR